MFKAMTLMNMQPICKYRW